MKASHAANDNRKDDLVRCTREVWQPRLGRNLSGEDIRQITDNLTGFFTLLAKWSQAERAAAGNDNNAEGSAKPVVKGEQLVVGRDRGGQDHD